MIFRETQLHGAFIIDPERREDERGFFARTFCSREFAAHNLDQTFVQCNVSFNLRKGTLRGMHFQSAPYEETKLVRCTRGSLYDVIIDLRRDSPTFKRYVAVTLSVENGRMLYIPKGFAHGFQTLEDNTEVFYQMGEYYAPEHQKGVRWDDQAFRIDWPAGDKIIIERDRTYPLFTA